MIMEMILIVVLLVFIGFGLYVLILDVTRWHAKDGNATPISLPLAAARSVSSVPTASPARADTRRSMSGKHHDFRAATLEGTIGDFQVKELVAQMRDPSKGLPVKTRYYNLKKRQACFTGAEAVDWFLASLHLKAREEALQYGEKLLMRGIIHNVSRLYPFADRRELLYRFSKRTRPHSLPFTRCTLTHTYTILNTAASPSPHVFSSLNPHSHQLRTTSCPCPTRASSSSRSRCARAFRRARRSTGAARGPPPSTAPTPSPGCRRRSTSPAATWRARSPPRSWSAYGSTATWRRVPRL